MEDAWKYLMQLTQNPGKSYPAFAGATDNWLGQLISRAQVPGATMPTMPTGFGGLGTPQGRAGANVTPGAAAPFSLDQINPQTTPYYGQIHNTLDAINRRFDGTDRAFIAGSGLLGGGGAPGAPGLGGYAAEPHGMAPNIVPGASFGGGRGLAA